MKKTFILVFPLLILGILFTGCKREEFVLNDQLGLSGADPSFAIPLAYTSLTLGDIERSFDSENFIYNESEQLFAFVYKKEIVRLGTEDLNLLENTSVGFSVTLSDAEAAAINALPAGQSFDVSYPVGLTFDFPEAPEIETVTFDGGFMTLLLSSDLPHPISGMIEIPGLTSGGVALQQAISLAANSTSEIQIPLEGYTLDLTLGGSGFNFIQVDADLTVTSSGQTTSAGAEVSFNFGFDFEAFSSIFGYLGTPEYTAVDTQLVNLFRNLNGGILHFADPRIELTVSNTSGIPFEINIAGVFAPENDVEQLLGGSDLQNIPIINAAAAPGEVGYTYHTITSNGTIPTLSAVLDEGPFELIYTSDILINPNGPQQNWVLDSSYLSCTAELILPFFCYADNFTVSDTLDLVFEDILGADDEGALDWNDVKKMQLRLIADNGLPVEMFGQVYFTDSLYNIIDSLYLDPENAFLASGYIDFSLPETHPDHGRVLEKRRTIRDSELTGQRIQHMIAEEARKVILKARSNTAGAAGQELVRFYPEYELKLKLSAKLDTQIDL